MISRVDSLNSASSHESLVFMTLAQRIKEARESIGLTQAAVGSAVGVQGLAVSRWERGESEPQAKTLAALAEALRCDPGWLLMGVEPQDSATEQPPDYPGLVEFLATKAGESVTSAELKLLRTLRASTGRPTADTYRMMLMVWRETSEQ